MTALPEHRRVLYGRTHTQPWAPGDYDPITVYPRTGSRMATVAYAAVCLAACVLIGWLLAQGF
jgi:hypothetical protein